MKPSRLSRILATDPALQPLVDKAREVASLARECAGHLPPELAAQVRAVNIRDGKLVILAANAAAAAKLKMLSARLSSALSKERGQVNSVSVRVQPNAPAKDFIAAHKSARISPVALTVLRALRGRFDPDSPARRSLERLLEHQSDAPAARSPR